MAGSDHAAGLVLFDIDGTLLRTGDPYHGAAFTYAFEATYGRPVTLDGVPLAGMLDAQIARILFERHGLDPIQSATQLSEMMLLMGQRYVEALAGAGLRDRVLPGVAAAVSACLDYRWTVGVLTGNARSVGQAKLRAAGLDSLLAFGAFGDTAAERGHLVEVALAEASFVTGLTHRPEQTVLIGDTPNDIAAARHAGAGVIAVATGRFDVEVLSQRAPDAIFPDLSDTDAFVTAIRDILGTSGKRSPVELRREWL